MAKNKTKQNPGEYFDCVVVVKPLNQKIFEIVILISKNYNNF